MGSYVVTDLTRFANREIVCTAMICRETGECFRPMPYFKYEVVRNLNITPGAIISGDLTYKDSATKPHVEDADYKKLKYTRPASGQEFLQILDKSSSSSIRDGFEYDFSQGQKFIPVAEPAACSIITLEVDQDCIDVLPNTYNPEKLKLTLKDSRNFELRNISITDLGFHEFAQNHHARGDLAIVNKHLRSADRIFVRIGLGRRYCQPNSNNDGYWLQANGIYTFPLKLGLVRGYGGE